MVQDRRFPSICSDLSRVPEKLAQVHDAGGAAPRRLSSDLDNSAEDFRQAGRALIVVDSRGITVDNRGIDA
jgi:hypothetical protein